MVIRRSRHHFVGRGSQSAWWRASINVPLGSHGRGGSNLSSAGQLGVDSLFLHTFALNAPNDQAMVRPVYELTFHITKSHHII
jgi:hypothetical protein